MSQTIARYEIRTTEGTEVRPVLDGTVEVGVLYEQFRQVFAADDAHCLFARPVPGVEADGRKVIRWMTDLEGEVRGFDDLTPTEQEELLWRVRNTMGRLHRLVEEHPVHDESERRALLRSLEKAFEIPGTASVFMIGGEPVLTEWGFVRSVWNAPHRVLRMLFDERLPVEGSLTVQVRSWQGAVPGMWVALETEGRADRRGVTDDTGAVCFAGLPLERALSVLVMEEAGPGGAVLARSTARLTAGAADQTVALTVDRPRRVVLRAVAADGSGPVPGVTVSVRAIDGSGTTLTMAEGVTNGAGELELPPVSGAAVALAGRMRLAEGNETPVQTALSADIDLYDVVIERPAPRLVRPVRRWPRPAVAGLIAAGLVLAGLVLAGLWRDCRLPWGSEHCWGDLRLLVVEAGTQSPVAGASLVVMANGTEIGRLESGADGVAVLPRQAQGSALTVSVTAADHAAGAATSMTCCTGQPMVVTVQRLMADLKVSVVDAATRAPIAGAEVVVRDPAGKAERGRTTTNAVGQAGFTGLPQGTTLAVSASAIGYAAGAASPMRCCGETPVVALNRILAELRVTVIDAATGAPIPGADVTLYERAGGPVRSKVAANQNGHANFPGQPQGASMAVVAMAAGYDPAPPQTVACCGEQAVVKLKRTMQPLQVKVVDARTGVGLSGVTVKFQHPTGSGSKPADQTGLATLPDLPAGTSVTIVAERRGYGSSEVTVTCCKGIVPIQLTQFTIIKGNNKFERASSGLFAAYYILEPGDRNFIIEINDNGADDDIQLFTETGKHLAGTDLGDEVWAAENVDVRSVQDMQDKVLRQEKGFKPNATYDSTSLNSGNGKFSLTSLYYTKYNGMRIGYSGDGFKTSRNEILKIDEVTERLIVMVVGTGQFDYKVDYIGPN